MSGPAYLTVPELAGLLRISERKVYDLAGAGEVPCVKVTGKLLFPAGEVEAWIRGGSSAAPPVLLGSHDPLLEWAVRTSCCGLALGLGGSRHGLGRLVAGEGVAAGLHLPDAGLAPEGGNVAAVADYVRDAALVGFATRARGLVLARGVGPIEGVRDLVGRPVVVREKGSGTATALDALLARAGLAPNALTVAEVARSERDAVEAVAERRGDATLGLETLARAYGLAFVPLMVERFDLLVSRPAWFEPPLQALMAFCRTPAFSARAAAMGGYDVGPLGAVRWNA